MITSSGRVRLLQFFAGLLPVGLAASHIDPPLYTSWWFIAAATTGLSATLLEPHYTAPRSALVNAAIPVTAFFVADHSGVDVLWVTLVVVALAVFLASVLLVADLAGQLADWMQWLSSRLGRVSLLGGLTLVIEALRLSSIDPREGAWLALGAALFLAAVSLDWPRVLLPKGTRARLAVLEAAVAPNLLLFSSESALVPGQKVAIERGSDSLSGYIVGHLAHKRTNRYQVITESGWRKVLPEAGTECAIKPTATETDETVGFVVEGTDELSIRFHPLDEIEHGQSLLVEGGAGRFLYQVTSLHLERDQWDNASGLQARAIAGQVGELANNSISLKPWLPSPYHPVKEAGSLAAELPDGYTKIGVVVGTQIPIGVRTAWPANDGHVGILGMSGMGKTTAARLLARAFEGSGLFVTVDGTGEYKSKLGWTDVDPIDWTQTGSFVHEPKGQPAVKCTEIIKAAMTISNGEFQQGEPRRRVLLLEEAHSFLPEWTFATSAQEKDTVSKSARYILQARKFGLSFVFVSQRTAVVSKSAISQCENFVIFRSIDQTSLEFIESIVGPVFKDAVAGLRKYQALCVGPIFNTESPVIVELLHPDGIT